MNRVRRNASSLFASEVARRILGFFSVALLARALGVEGFGMVMVGLTVLSYVSLTGSAGLHVFGTRNVARGDDALDPGAVVGARLLNTLAAMVVVLIVTVVWVEPPALAEVILITSLSGVLHALFLEWYFQGRERMTETAIARTLSAFLYLGFIVVSVHGPQDLRRAALAAVVADLGSTGYLLIRYRSSVGPLRISFRSWLPLMRAAWPFGAGSVLGHLSINLPVLVVAALLGSRDAGVFSGANKLVFFLLMADRIFGTILLPASARLQNEEGDRLRTTLARALRWILLVGLPVCVGGTALATPLVTLVYGPAFAASGEVFRILVWYALLTMIHTVYTSGVLALGGERQYRNVMTISAALYGFGVVGGVLAGGVLGAVVGILIAEGTTVVLMERATRPKLDALRPARFGRIVMASIVLAVGLPFLPSSHVLGSVAMGAALYIAAALTVGAVTVDELRQLNQRST